MKEVIKTLKLMSSSQKLITKRKCQCLHLPVRSYLQNLLNAEFNKHYKKIFYICSGNIDETINCDYTSINKVTNNSERQYNCTRHINVVSSNGKL